jgi:hypothetical protein
MPFDPNKPATLGPLSSAEIRENFRALKEDRIVDAGWLSGSPISAFVLKSTPTVITAVHTFNPTTAGAPFTLGANAQGQLITGLNADTVDGQHANAFASATHNHDTSYIRKGTADTITAVHTFSPSNASAPFILDTNAQGQLVAGLNADTVDGQHANAFAPASHNHDASYVRKGTADTITAVHTFNPSSAGAPFILGANAQGRLVTGLNADTVDGKHAEEFAPANHNHDASYVRKGTADTITAVHTFNPSSAGAPFILGANAQGHLVTGLNADMVDGYHMTDFRRAMTSDITVTVGSGGDFSTINDAINYLVNNFLPPCYRSSSGTPRATILILSGTTIAEHIHVLSLDLSWITIKSVDITVPVNLGSIGGTFLFGSNNAKLPVIATTFSIYSTHSSTKGILVRSNSEAFIRANGGIIISNKGHSALSSLESSIIKGEGFTKCVGSSKDNVEYAIYADASMVFLPESRFDRANVLVYGRSSFIRLLGSDLGPNYNTKFSLSSCDCIPSS